MKLRSGYKKALLRAVEEIAVLEGLIFNDDIQMEKWVGDKIESLFNKDKKQEKDINKKIYGDDAKVCRHESYGVVRLGRSTYGSPTNLFGSSVKHSTTISLTIKTAHLNRYLNNDRFHGDDRLIQIEMSPVQFSELITGININDGVPCTITNIDYDICERPPYISKKQQFSEEFKFKLDNVFSNSYGSIKKILKLLDDKKPLKRSQRDDIKSFIQIMVQEIKSNLPYIQRNFDKAMDRTVSECKHEVEAFINEKICNLGLKAINEGKFPEIGYDEENKT